MPVSFKKKGNLASKTFRKREQPEGSEGEANDEALRPNVRQVAENIGEVNPSAPKRQKTQHIGGIVASVATTKESSVYKPYEASKSIEQSYRGDIQIEGKYRDDRMEKDEVRDSERTKESALYKGRLGAEQAGNGENHGGEPFYRGQAAYRSFLDRDEAEVQSIKKRTGTHGPLRAPTFVRTTARFDYQASVCKDYKETGTCGYGDSCIFLHDRGDYKSGWQMEAEWEKAQVEAKNRLELSSFMGEGSDGGGGGGGEKEEELPFACYICRGEFKNPVITTCNHYFCGKCIMSRNGDSSSTKCPVCGKQTFGVYNSASKLIKRLAERKKKENGSVQA
jgi:RING finger protein 113A